MECLAQMWMLNIPVGPSAPVDAITVDSNTPELGILLSVDNDDLDAFAQNISQLKPRYATLASLGAATFTRTERKCHALGLDLMYLLLENCLLEFHPKMKLLTEEEVCVPHVASAQDGVGLCYRLRRGVIHGTATGLGCHDEVQLDGRAVEVRTGEYVREKRDD